MNAEQEKTLHEEAMATLGRLERKNPELKQALERARGFAVFPSMGRASLVLGGTYGHGEVFERGKPIGFATLSQMTIGVQVGGQTFSELIFFEDRNALEDFKGGKVAFAANASAVIIKAAASGTTNYAKCTAHAYSRGGMLLEVSLGGQKFTFMPPSSEKERQAKDSEEGGGREKEASSGEGAGGGLQRWLHLRPRHPTAVAKRASEDGGGRETEDSSREDAGGGLQRWLQAHPRHRTAVVMGVSTLATLGTRLLKTRAHELRAS
ncbi:lipid-binding SYLF domain-containing protein [Myxococcus stipitatus]|uniref:lipid-binding SYLF domain-containing protein n=1 Tax=Myxococcus stipitatus TaxID=83455 RepID=UPI001F21EAAB|nr:lipid-binding SYLF domain-containing protein [Myxococcus stipitatus]MCE9673157.1 lipid-binding SYLF domain-containing protein [Myxococcus stipitatus]